MRRTDENPYWNTNVARHPDILRAVPEGCGDALDVGCGDGLLARKLAKSAKRVTGVDSSAVMIARARELAADRPEPTFIEGDFLTVDLPAAGFDFICSVTAIHHMDFEAALTRMRDLLRPGGTLVVVGLAKETTLTDWAAYVAATPIVRVTKLLRHASGPEGMPAAPARMGYRDVQEGATPAARSPLPPARAPPLLPRVAQTAALTGHSERSPDPQRPT